MEFAVSREVTTLVTLHGGSDTTACDEATDELGDSLASLAAAGTIADWEIVDAAVHEHPTAPVDPYTIAVEFSVTVVAEADGESEAETTGANAIDDALENADLDGVSYTTAPAASTA